MHMLISFITKSVFTSSSSRKTAITILNSTKNSTLKFLTKSTKMPLTQVTIPSTNKLGSLPGYLSAGEHKQGVVVIQEWFGEKFVAIVPDLYRGQVATDHEHAGHLMNGLDWSGAVEDIQGAVNYLRSCGVENIAVTGFCMGGALAIAAAVRVDGLRAAAPFYGIPSKELADPSKVRVPIQCHFASLDSLKGFSDPEAANALENTLKEAKVSYEFHRYEDVDHGFANETRPVYNESAAKLAQTRAVEFFQKNLQF